MGLEKAGLLRTRKAFQLLAKLSSKELKGFRNFLESPFFNPHASRRKSMIAVFDRACKLKIWERDLSREDFVKRTDIPSDRNGFDKVVSAFYDKIDEFTSILAFRENGIQQHVAALNFMQNRGATSDELQKRVHLAEKFLETTPNDAEYFNARLNFDLEFAQSVSNRSSKADVGRFAQLHTSLDRYFYIQKLRFLCASATEKYLFPGTSDPLRMSETLAWIRQFENPPILGQLYLQTYQILNGEGTAADVASLFELLRRNELRGFVKDIEDIYSYLINYYIRQLNKGDTSALQPLDQLHEGILKLDLIGEEGFITPDHFKNIVSVKCKLGDYEGAWAFLNAYQERLSDALEGSLVAYNTGVVHFHEGTYDLAIPILEELIEAKGRIKADEFIGLDSRGILLKSYYEVLDLEDLGLVAWEELLEKANALIRSLKPFIARRGLSEVRKETFSRFLFLYRGIFQLRFQSFLEDDPKRDEAWLEMGEAINATPHFSDRDWFVEKINAKLPPHRQI